MNPKYKRIIIDTIWAIIALLAGSIIVYFGDRLLNVRIELFHGISTFNPIWVADLILVPLIAGIVVSLIYGLGGKILAHFSPIIVRVISLVAIEESALPDGVTVFPLGYWILLVIVSVEACAAGGLIGEIIVKKTYGRRPKHLIHKRFKLESVDKSNS